MLEPNSFAPDFTLLDQNEKSHTLSDYKNKFIILYFYPKDDTPGCTKEACAFQNAFEELSKMNITLFGISSDSVASHKKFSEKYHLSFPLLSDPEKKVIKAYKAKGLLFTKRITYLIGPGLIIKNVYPEVDPILHASSIIDDIKKIQENKA